MSNLVLLPIPVRSIARMLATGTEHGVMRFSVVYPTRGRKAWGFVHGPSAERQTHQLLIA